MYIPYPALLGIQILQLYMILQFITYLKCYTVLFKGTYEELWARDIPEKINLNYYPNSECLFNIIFKYNIASYN